MKTLVSFLGFLLIGALGAPADARAQGSTLRIACQGKDVGAEVSINGQFKGECPLEARVPAGTVKLRVAKKIDSQRERVFEQDIRLGEDVVKQIDAVLSAPRLVAAGRQNETPLAIAQPVAAKPAAAQPAKAEAASAPAMPARPQIPLGISETVWKIIEASELYRNSPQPRAIKIAFRGRKEVEYTGSKSSSLPNPGATAVSTTREITPAGDRCTITRTYSGASGEPDGALYGCGLGFLHLGMTSGGKLLSVIDGIDELEGSLFPMRIGARLTMRFQMAFASDRKYDSKHALECEVTSRMEAREVDPRLDGIAWKTHCKSSYTGFGSGNTSENDDYYLENLAAMLSTLGQPDNVKKTSVLPSPGTQTLIVADGEYGSRNTTTYDSYEWTVGSAASAHAASPVVPASSSEVRPAVAAGEGNAAAMASMGARYETGQGVTQSFEQAAAWYRKAAEAGDSAGMAGLGSMYLNGTGVPKDAAQARKWFSKAAEGGNGRGMNGIGILYDRGEGGLPKDSVQAKLWVEKAAAAGEARAMANLGIWYANGHGVPKDEVEAVSWYRKAAAAGSADGMYALGYAFAKGQGVVMDEAEAVSWYRKAAAAGSVKAMYELGFAYRKGQGVAENPVEAVSWYRKAALAGHVPSMTALGYLLYAGVGAPKNEAEGIAWERKAAALGDEQAIKNLQISLAEQAARNNPQNAAPAARGSDGGSAFFGAVLGGVASGLLERNAATLNSMAGNTGGAGGAVMGALGRANSQLAAQTRQQISRDMGGDGGVAGVAGMAVGGALASGSTGGAVAAFSGAGNNLAASAPAGAGGGAGPDTVRPCLPGQHISQCGGLRKSKTSSAEADKAAECVDLKNYHGPSDDPQTDVFCKQAWSNLCMAKATGNGAYEVRAKSVCNVLNDTLRVTKSSAGRASKYCSNYCR